MNSDADNRLPSYITKLLAPTPANKIKLIALWDGLGAERQLQILERLSEGTGFSDLAPAIFSKALESNNAYVRYVAASNLDLYKKSDPKRLRVEADPNQLVRSAINEQDSVIKGFGGGFYADGEKIFWEQYTQEERLASVSKLSSHGSEVADLVEFALERGLASDSEISEILLEYVRSDSFVDFHQADASYDGWLETKRFENLQKLWQLVSAFGEDSHSSFTLIKFLPQEPKGYGAVAIPEGLLERLTPWQTNFLLDRSDITLTDFRKEVFRAGHEPGWRAAASWHFDLTEEEFAELLQKPTKERDRFLAALIFSENLQLFFLGIINDLLFMGDSWEMAQGAVMQIERRLEDVEWASNDRAIINFRLYELAKRVVPWDSSEDGWSVPAELSFLREKIVQGDTFATFVGFKKAWHRLYHRNAPVSAVYALPDLCSYGEPYSFRDDLEEKVNTEAAEREAQLPEDTPDKFEVLQEELATVSRELTELKQALGDSMSSLSDQGRQKDASEDQLHSRTFTALQSLNSDIGNTLTLARVLLVVLLFGLVVIWFGK